MTTENAAKKPEKSGRNVNRGKLKRYPGLRQERSRHGKIVFYYRNHFGRRVRVRGIPETPEFDLNYRNAASGLANPAPSGKYTSMDHKIAPAVNMLSKTMRGARERAKAKRLPFELDVDWLIETLKAQDGVCALTGLEFDTTNTRNPFGPSLDRITPIEGYTKENTRIVVLAINVMLNDWGEEVFRRVARNYALRRKAW